MPFILFLEQAEALWLVAFSKEVDFEKKNTMKEKSVHIFSVINQWNQTITVKSHHYSQKKIISYHSP